MRPIEQAWRLLKTDPSLMEPAGYLPVEGNEQLMVDAMQKPRYGETQFFNQMAGRNTAAKYPNWMNRDHADNMRNRYDRRAAMIEAPGKSMYDPFMNDISRDKLISGGHVLTDAVNTDQPLIRPAKGAGGKINIGGGKTCMFNIAHPTSTRAGNLPHIRDKDRQGIERRAIHPQAASMAARNQSGGGGGGWVQRVIPEEEHPDFFAHHGTGDREGIVETIGSDDVYSYTAPRGVHERFQPQARQAIRDLVGQEAYGSEEEKQAAMRDAVAHLDRSREEYDPKRAWGGWASDKWDRFKEGLGEIKPWLRETFRRSDDPMDYAWALLKSTPKEQGR